MGNEEGSTNKKSFWHTLPGIVSATAAIITALTGLFVAIHNNSKTSSAKNDLPKQEIVQKQESPKITLAMAEQMANQFINACKKRSADEIVSLISVPFYFDYNIETDMDEIHSKFQKDFQEHPNQPFPEIKSIKVKTVKEWKIEGKLNNGDRILENLNINDDDFYSVIESPPYTFSLGFRIVGNKLKIAGMWD